MGFNNLSPEMLDLIARAGGANVAAQTGVLNLGPGDQPLQQPTPFQAAGPTGLGTALEGVGQLGTELASPVTNLAAAAQSADPIGRFVNEFDPNLTLFDAFQEVGLPANVATGVLAFIGEFGIPDPFGGFDDLLSFARAARNVDDLAPLLGLVGRGGFGEGDFTIRGVDRRQADLGAPGGVERRAGERRADFSPQALFTDPESIDTPARLQRAISSPEFEVGRREFVVQQVVQSAEFDRAFNALAEEGRQTAQEFIQGVMEGYRAGAFTADEAADMLGEIDTDLAESFKLNNMLNEIPETLRQQIETPFDPSFAEGVDARFEDLELQMGAAGRQAAGEFAALANQGQALEFSRQVDAALENPRLLQATTPDEIGQALDELVEAGELTPNSRAAVQDRLEGASIRVQQEIEQAFGESPDILASPPIDRVGDLLLFEFQNADIANFLMSATGSAATEGIDERLIAQLGFEMQSHLQRMGSLRGSDLIDIMVDVGFTPDEATRLLESGAGGIFPDL